MDTIMQAEIFFFISSVGFILLWAFFAAILFYVMKSFRTFSRIMLRIEKSVDEVSDETKEMIESMRDSILFRFLFGPQKKTVRKTRSKK